MSRHELPSQISGELSLFDKFATMVARFAARAAFFACCVVLVLVWAPSFFLFGDVDTWQLVINTATTIVTFLLVALLQNTQKRADDATQHKLNALTLGVLALIEQGDARGAEARGELRAALGLERRESA